MQDMLHTLRLPQRDAAGLPLPGDPDRSLSAVESVQLGLIWRVCKLHPFLLRLPWEVARLELEPSGSGSTDCG